MKQYNLNVSYGKASFLSACTKDKTFQDRLQTRNNIDTHVIAKDYLAQILQIVWDDIYSIDKVNIWTWEVIFTTKEEIKELMEIEV